MATIKFLTQKIEVEQIRKLQELSSTAVSGQTAGEFLSFGGAPGLHAMNGRVSPGGGGESDFERLVFGKKDSEPANDGFEWQQSASPNVPAHVPTPPPRLTTGAQKFSWSSPSPTIQQQQQQSVGAFSTLQPSVGGFGSTTAFPAPMSSNRNTGGALDWSAAMEPPSAPAPRATSSGGGSGAVDWSSSAQTLFPANTGNGHRVGTAPQMLSGLSLGNSSNDNSNSNSHTPQNGFASAGQRKAGGIQLANFGSFGAAPAPAIRPPPPTNTAFSAPSGGMSIRAGMNDGGMNAGFNKGGFNTSTAKKVEPKKGLDQWESLI